MCSIAGWGHKAPTATFHEANVTIHKQRDCLTVYPGLANNLICANSGSAGVPEEVSRTWGVDGCRAGLRQVLGTTWFGLKPPLKRCCLKLLVIVSSPSQSTVLHQHPTLAVLAQELKRCRGS